MRRRSPRDRIRIQAAVRYSAAPGAERDGDHCPIGRKRGVKVCRTDLGKQGVADLL